MDMRELQSFVERCIRPIRQRVLMVVSRGTLNSTADSKDIQESNVTLMKDEDREIERIQNYGFASHPPKQSELVCVFVGGNRENGFVIAAEPRGKRPKLGEGETAMWVSKDDFMKLKPGGKVIIKNANGDLIPKLKTAFASLAAEPFIVNKTILAETAALLATMEDV